MPQPFDQTKRVYPRLPQGHAELQPLFDQMHDNLYALRDQIQEMKAAKNQGAATPANKPFTLDIAGIKVNAPTDPTSLQNGFTLRYNSATGQFDFGT